MSIYESFIKFEQILTIVNIEIVTYGICKDIVDLILSFHPEINDIIEPHNDNVLFDLNGSFFEKIELWSSIILSVNNNEHCIQLFGAYEWIPTVPRLFATRRIQCIELITQKSLSE